VALFSLPPSWRLGRNAGIAVSGLRQTISCLKSCSLRAVLKSHIIWFDSVIKSQYQEKRALSRAHKRSSSVYPRRG
jgi:hypothetical protein